MVYTGLPHFVFEQLGVLVPGFRCKNCGKTILTDLDAMAEAVTVEGRKRLRTLLDASIKALRVKGTNMRELERVLGVGPNGLRLSTEELGGDFADILDEPISDESLLILAPFLHVLASQQAPDTLVKRYSDVANGRVTAEVLVGRTFYRRAGVAQLLSENDLAPFRVKTAARQAYRLPREAFIEISAAP
jgi:hypothetical protein